MKYNEKRSIFWHKAFIKENKSSVYHRTALDRFIKCGVCVFIRCLSYSCCFLQILLLSLVLLSFIAFLSSIYLRGKLRHVSLTDANRWCHFRSKHYNTNFFPAKGFLTHASERSCNRNNKDSSLLPCNLFFLTFD